MIDAFKRAASRARCGRDCARAPGRIVAPDARAIAMLAGGRFSDEALLRAIAAEIESDESR